MTDSLHFGRKTVEFEVDELIDENLELIIFNNSESKTHIRVTSLELSINDLVDKLEKSRDEVLEINQDFPEHGCIQFEVSMTSEQRPKEERKLAVKKMYPVKESFHKYFLQKI